MCAESYKFVLLIMEEQLYLVGYSQISSFYCSEGLANMISCELNVEMSTGFVPITLTTFIHFRMCFEWNMHFFLGFLKSYIHEFHPFQSAHQYSLYFLTIEENSSGLPTCKSPDPDHANTKILI